MISGEESLCFICILNVAFVFGFLINKPVPLSESFLEPYILSSPVSLDFKST